MKREDFVCGIDGGGTRTTAICCNLQGNEISRRIFGPFNLNSIGEQAFEKLLNDIILFLKDVGTCRGLCIGAAGVNNLRMAQMVEKVFSGTGIPYRLLGDQEIAHTGALDGREGIILIAGTGSVCFGKNSAGKSAMAGGWGHLLGDEGSGYGLGLDALAAVARQIDGYGRPTVLTDMIAEEFGLDSPEKIVSYVYSKDKSAVAGISHLLDRACIENDRVAVEIIRHNAEGLADIVQAVSKRLEMPSCNVALLGGLLEHPTCLKAEFVHLLKETNPGLKCVAPLHSAVQGAVMEALKLLQ